ncbi:succinyldiaminopimelate transaminase [Candidatus Magnetaquicoccus inordinatus]|uniref:succinyldiaminopimelate transaminase n=1 Tax=Candidatus Magnetaquicoccus inordinatus TaxID=2496818 RepID=UPI00102BA64C|nr:succinyldiaminopimelate transaminase [Candidatus Magnetaquicoccus inordinatus]
MNSLLRQLHPYPFEKLAALLGADPEARSSGHAPSPAGEPLPAINLSIGEPKHPVPAFIRQTMADALEDIGLYPTTRGELSLRQAMANWVQQRFQLKESSVDPQRHILPVNGTREALFSIAQAVVDNSGNDRPYVLMPNPFYQIYEGATLMAGAQPVYVPCHPDQHFLPDYQNIPPAILERTALLYLCSPGNPTGAVFPLATLQKLIELALRYQIVLASDECYSEIWYDHPPAGLLQAAQQMGVERFDQCLVFHSLSKRSNMPGARSGFVAGDARLLEEYFRLRTYTGCATPRFIQRAAIAAWQDEEHVRENRILYQQKLHDALQILTPILPVEAPDAGFYLWLRVPGGGESFARHLYQRYHVTVLPGAYLGRPDVNGHNPGADYVRIAMVASREENHQAMLRIAHCAQELLSLSPTGRNLS